jgi:hypothetical protein
MCRYGQAGGPRPDGFQGNPPQPAVADPVPWIASFDNDPAKTGEPGFWPINIVLGNAQVGGRGRGG